MPTAASTRRAISSTARFMLAGLLRTESALISEGTRVYLRDVHDHCVRIIDVVETYRTVMRIPFAAHTAMESLRWAVRSTPRPDGRRFLAALAGGAAAAFP